MNSVHNEIVIYIVDDDFAVRDAIAKLVTSVGMTAVCFSSAEEFLCHFDSKHLCCLILDVRMNGMGGIELQKELIKQGDLIPIIFITGHGDIPMTVDALKSGAVNFIEKPFRNQVLLDSIYSAIKTEERNRENDEKNNVLMKNFSILTEREKQVSNYISQGLVSKQIAEKLHLSPRTIESHRANILKKMNSANTFDLMKKLIQINSILVNSK